MKLLEARVLDNDNMETFIVPDLVDDYYIKVEYYWFGLSETGVNLFKHWSNISFWQAIIFKGIPMIIVSMMRILLVLNIILDFLTLMMVPWSRELRENTRLWMNFNKAG